MLHSLLDTGGFNLHSVHRSFKTGSEERNWNLGELLKGVFRMLHYSPASRKDYESINDSSKHPLYFCAFWYCVDPIVFLLAVSLFFFFRRMLMETNSNKIGTPCNSWGFTKKLGGTKLKWGD